MSERKVKNHSTSATRWSPFSSETGAQSTRKDLILLDIGFTTTTATTTTFTKDNNIFIEN